MKKIYLLLSIILTSLTASATIHNVLVANFSFTPNAISVVVGDTIRWTINGTGHTTTSVSVPVGAAMWDHSFAASGESFDYKVEVAGNYGYVCTPHSASMMGSFVATNPVGLSVSKQTKVVTDSKAYPNPFKTKITIPTKDAETIEIFSVLGEKVKTIETSMLDKVTIDLSDLRKGVYFYALKDESGVIETRKIVKSE